MEVYKIYAVNGTEWYDYGWDQTDWKTLCIELDEIGFNAYLNKMKIWKKENIHLHN